MLFNGYCNISGNCDDGTADVVPTGTLAPGILTWEAVEKRVPWGLVLMMGGGFAMAEGASKSGLSHLIGQQLKYLETLPHLLIVVLIVTFATFLTEIVSNMTTANILVPVVRDLVSSMNHSHFIYIV